MTCRRRRPKVCGLSLEHPLFVCEELPHLRDESDTLPLTCAAVPQFALQHLDAAEERRHNVGLDW